MATRKKAKTKAKKKKTSTGKPVIRKKVARKKSRPKENQAKGQGRSQGKTGRRPRAGADAKPAAPAIPPGTERIGVVTHYFSHLSVAIVQLETGSVRASDVVHIKGHTSDFTQPVESMEIDHVRVSEVRPGQSFGLRVRNTPANTTSSTRPST